MADVHDFQVDIVPDQGSVTTNNRDGSYYVEMPKDNVQYRIRLKNNGSAKCDAVVTIDGKNMGTFRINGSSQMLLERPTDVERRFTFFVGGSEGSKQGGYKEKDKNNGLVQVLFKPEHIQRQVYIPKQSTGYYYRGQLYEGSRKKEHTYDNDSDNDEYCGNGDFEEESYPESAGPRTRGSPESTGSRKRGGHSVPTSKGINEGCPCPQSASFGAPKAKGMSKSMNNAPTRGYKEGMTALTGDSTQKFTTVALLDYDLANEVTIYLRLVYRDVRPKIEPLRSVGSKKSTRYPNPV
uniref:Uncharacterized protein n=1 Tax=Marseillevirus LCMAC101 TaxID=2506602 RepID=A0A481YTN3_9VIRU|nr:MAG: hypothetical protein LCMAC101_07200 [Marseillevirus LCMAC101]